MAATMRPVVAAVGWAIERFVARPLYQRDHLDHVLGTFGLILVIDTMAHLIWGPEGFNVPLPAWLDGQVTIWPPSEAGGTDGLTPTRDPA